MEGTIAAKALFKMPSANPQPIIHFACDIYFNNFRLLNQEHVQRQSLSPRPTAIKLAIRSQSPIEHWTVPNSISLPSRSEYITKHPHSKMDLSSVDSPQVSTSYPPLASIFFHCWSLNTPPPLFVVPQLHRCLLVHSLHLQLLYTTPSNVLLFVPIFSMIYIHSLVFYFPASFLQQQQQQQQDTHRHVCSCSFGEHKLDTRAGPFTVVSLFLVRLFSIHTSICRLPLVINMFCRIIQCISIIEFFVLSPLSTRETGTGHSVNYCSLYNSFNCHCQLLFYCMA